MDLPERGGELIRYLLAGLIALVAVALVWYGVPYALGSFLGDNEGPPETFSFRILVPDVEESQQIEFSPTDVEGLRLDQAVWDTEQGTTHDFARVFTGLTHTEGQALRYCLADDVTLLERGIAIDIAVEAGACTGRGARVIDRSKQDDVGN